MKQVRIVGILSLFLLMQVFAISSMGQEVSSTSSGSLTYGVHIGVTGSTFSDEQPHRSIILDYTGGIHGNYSFSESFGVQGELNYFEHGGGLLQFTDPGQLTTEPAFDSEVKDMKISIRTLEIPVMANFAIDMGPSILRIMVGPTVEWVMHAGSKTQTTARFPGSPSVYTTYSEEENITNEVSQFIYNAAGGLSLEFPFVKETSLFLDARYRYSINEVLTRYSYLGLQDSGSALRQHSVSLNLGINF